MMALPVLALHLRTLADNPGILPVREAKAYMQTDHWTIIKNFNLTKIGDDLTYTVHSFREFNNLVKDNVSNTHHLVAWTVHLDYLRDITIQKYRQLVPQQRFKRGILNPLGSIVKIITGNLDHEDALRYDKLISNLGQNQIDVSKKLTLVSQIIDSFIETTGNIDHNVDLLEKRMKTLETVLKELVLQKRRSDYSTYIMSFYNLFISNFRTIFIRLGEIETALAFSRVGILHQSIVNSTELLYHFKLISNTENLVYAAIENNLVKLEETVNIKSYIKHNQLTFIIEVPLTDNNTYNYYKLYALPIFHEAKNITLTIFPRYPFLLAKGMKYLPIEKPCRSLAAGDHYLCTDDNRASYPEVTCAEQLMRFEDNLTCCVQRPIHIEAVRVQPVAVATWILYTRIRTTVTSYCDTDVTKHPVFGTYLITLDEPCELEVSGIRIQRYRIYTESDSMTPIPVINLPLLPANTVPDAFLSSTRTLNMRQVNLDEVKYMTYALKQNELVNSVLRDSDSKFSVVLYVTLTLVLTCCLLFVFYVLRKKIVLMFTRNQRNAIKNGQPDDFALGEEGVMHAPRPSVLD